MIQIIFINLHPNEYGQEFHYYPFAVNLDHFVGSCNNLIDLSNKVFIPNKTEGLNLSVFNMITGINESKTLAKHVSSKYKCKFDWTKCKSGHWWNNDKCRCGYKKHHICEKDYVSNSASCSFENRKSLASIMDDSAIIYNEVIGSYAEEIKTISTNFNEKKVTFKTRNFYILLAFLLSF